MKLTVTSLSGSALVEDDIVSLRAGDASGWFGIRSGHADLLTVLDVGVVSWLHATGHERHCAVRRGVLRVSQGRLIDIASREAIVDDDLERLESTVLAEFRGRGESEQSVRNESQRLELQLIREMLRFLQPEKDGMLGRQR